MIQKFTKMNQEFYITLPSNVRYLPGAEENSITNYKTKLSRKIEFPKDEDWRVGLAEITYTKSWFNVRNKVKIEFFSKFGDITFKEFKAVSNIQEYTNDEIEDTIDKNAENYSFIVYIKPGYYESIDTLCDSINLSLSLLGGICEKCPLIKFDRISHIITIEPGNNGGVIFFPYLGEEVELILGLNELNSKSFRERTRENDKCLSAGKFANHLDANIAFDEKVYYGKRCAELNAGCQSLFVYCNIVDHSPVGDSSAQLLRTVEVPSDLTYAQNINLIYDKPHFIRLQTNSFDIINLDIRDDTFEKIPFQFGRVIIKLIFRLFNTEKNA